MSKFQMNTTDYGVVANIRLDSAADSHPNQPDLREALNRLLNCLQNWDSAEIDIKTVEEK